MRSPRAGSRTSSRSSGCCLVMPPPFERRGAASNEYIEAFRNLWTEKAPHYDGEFVSFKNVSFEPKPAQAGGPPIWIGGEGMAARKRTARLGDGWYPVMRNPRHMMDTPEKSTVTKPKK